MKFLFLILCLTLSLLCPSYAQFEGPGSERNVVKVSDIKKTGNYNSNSVTRNLKKFVLIGHIIEQTGKRDYLFQDDTGTIEVTIRDRYFKNDIITPENLVRLEVRVSSNVSSKKLNVKKLDFVRQD